LLEFTSTFPGTAEVASALLCMQPHSHILHVLTISLTLTLNLGS